MSYHVLANQTHQTVVKYLLRGDSQGRIHIWNVPNVTTNQLAQLQQEKFDKPPCKYFFKKYFKNLRKKLISLVCFSDGSYSRLQFNGSLGSHEASAGGNSGSAGASPLLEKKKTNS